MAFDKNKPEDNGIVSEAPQELRNNFEQLATMFDEHSGSTLFTGTIRFDKTACKFLRYNGSDWDDKLISVAGGGTGIGSYTTGDILYASATDTLSKLAGVATGNSLLSGGVGTAPSWGKIGLTTHVSGTLPVANGGTNKTSFTDGYVHYGNFDTSSALSFNSGTGTLSATNFSGNGSALTNLNAGNITTGTISIDRLPHGALERLVVTADMNTILTLDTDDVQNGDTVKVTSTGTMYYVKDETQLGTLGAFEVYTAGAATSVPWSGVSSTPTTASGYGITDAVTTSGNQTIDGTKEFSSTITGSISGNAATATKLANTITLWGQDFNGSENVSGLLSGPGSIELTGTFGSVDEDDIALSGAGTKMIWNPKKAAFRVGYVDGSQWDNTNVGAVSTAMGASTTASGDGSTAMGSGTTASGDYSTAMGRNTTASVSYSTAMGNNTTASGGTSTAMGYSTTASGNYSIAMGYSTTASGNYSTAMGYSTTASGNYSTAMGLFTKAESFASVAIGRYNVGGGSSSSSWASADPLFEIGNGTGDSDGERANAFTVYKNGNATLSGTLTGTFSGNLNGNATTATTLAAARKIYGNNFDGSADLAQVIASTYGGTGNGFTKFTGPATSEKTFTLPNASATLLYSGGALGTPSSGNLTNCTFPTLNQDTTGNAATATTAGSADSAGYAAAVTCEDEHSDETCYVTFVNSATGNLAVKTGSNLTFDSSIGRLTATSFVGTLTTAAQPYITSLGTLTTLTVDNININGSTITGLSNANTVLTAYAGKAITVEGVSFDGGVVTGISSLTATTMVGNVTGNVSGSSGSCAGNSATATKVNNALTAGTGLTSTGAFDGSAARTFSHTAHTGDVTGATVLTIANKAVTLAKMDDMATASLIYRRTAGTGTPEVNTLATLKSDLGSMTPTAHAVNASTYGYGDATNAGHLRVGANLSVSSGTISHPTTEGNKHVPSGGSSGQILKYSSAGTAAWGAITTTGNHTVTLTPEGSGSITLYSTYRTLSYIRVDDLVHLRGVMKVSSVSSPIGLLRMSLPFPIASGSIKYHGVANVMVARSNANMADYMAIYVNGESSLRIYLMSGADLSETSSAQMKANTEIYVDFTYETDDS